jgi:hypothetical protein
MAVRIDFEEVVARRARRIADAARVRTHDRRRAAEASAPLWLRRAVGFIPPGGRDALRVALGDEPLWGRARALMEQAREARDRLRHREDALDAARVEIERARRRLEEDRLELDGRTRAAERAEAAAERVASEQTAERRVPRSAIEWDPADSPRPIRGVARLAANIRRFGQLTPIVVCAAPTEGRYRLLSGWRRMSALEMADATHALIRVVPAPSAATAAALYVAENCLVDGQPANAIRHLGEQLGEAPPAGFARVLAAVAADDEATVEEMYLDDIAADCVHHLAEGAAWLSTLRPHWVDLEPEERRALEDFLLYFARVHQRVSGRR